jgi:ferrochelatase
MTENNAKKGVLIANLGTPEAPERKPVARFLREFLSDPRVVDLPRYLWLPLLNLVIIPLRAGRSAAAYREIWGPGGSPLLTLTRQLADRLAIRLSGRAEVSVGMRYGEPSIHGSLQQLKSAGVTDLAVIPLYPQFSDTTTSSIYDAVDQSLQQLQWAPKQHRVEDYHDHPAWVSALAASIRSFREENGFAEKLIFSLHGIPQRFVDKKGDPYEQQCRASVALIAEALGLSAGEWMLTFQSRVGREPWLQPYTDITLKELAAAGVKHVQVACPGFAVDCLETLEEIAMQNREFFEEAGGKKLEYIPALNDSPAHAETLEALLQDWLD